MAKALLFLVLLSASCAHTRREVSSISSVDPAGVEYACATFDDGSTDCRWTAPR